MNIQVALTTTGFLAESGHDEKTETAIWHHNIPVCIVEAYLLMYGASLEWLEHVQAKACKEMAKVVSVDPSRRSVFIGLNPSNEETGLVTYTQDEDNKYSQEFFRRWDKTKMMIFQFHLMSQNDTVFSLVGLWCDNSWKDLDVRPRGSIFILNK